jgi:hypothetical protein
MASPTMTVIPDVNPFPEIVRSVPPRVLPLIGAILVMFVEILVLLGLGEGFICGIHPVRKTNVKRHKIIFFTNFPLLNVQS